MKRNTMIKILKALNSGSGVGAPLRFPLSQVVFLSGVPRMTTYRYLTDAVCLGFVEVSTKKFHGMMAMHYAITDAGRDFAGLVR
jgi:DNA-binding IclR family transcriptional regulator